MSQRLEPGASVIVEVPATTANLGPGFDCFGLAFSWRERMQLTVIERGYQLDVTGEGAVDIPRDESHLILRSALTALADLGLEVPGLRLQCRNTIPHGRGLGSSSAAIVAGLAAAAALAGRPLERDWLLSHANAIEGHPDNVAAAICGGFVLAYTGRAGVSMVASPVDPSVEAAVYVADTPVATHAARSVLPPRVPHLDAAANSGRAALLVHALARDPGLLYDATQDWLHQSYRATAMPQSFALLTSLRRRGFAAVISGAGPSVAVLGRGSDLAALDDQASPRFTLRRVGIGTGVLVA